MAKINDNFLKLAAGYLFPEIGRRVSAFSEANPEAKVIRLGIGDVTEPLPPAIVEAMHRAVDEMAAGDTFRGYGPEQGYDFLRDAVVENDYRGRGVDVSADEIFVSDGSKCDTGNILDIFGADNVVADGARISSAVLKVSIRALINLDDRRGDVSDEITVRVGAGEARQRGVNMYLGRTRHFGLAPKIRWLRHSRD